MPPPSPKKKGGWKHWALFAVRWGIAVVGVWIIVSHMSVRDQAWVILNHQTNRPAQVSLRRAVGDAAATRFPIYDPTTKQPRDVPRADVVNQPDAKAVNLVQPGGAAPKKVTLLGLDLIGDVNAGHAMMPPGCWWPTTRRPPAYWVTPGRVAGVGTGSRRLIPATRSA